MERADYPRCRACRHWDVPRYTNVGVCRLMTDGLGDSHALAWTENHDNGITKGDPVMTGYDFGCIQHEERDDGTTHDEG